MRGSVRCSSLFATLSPSMDSSSSWELASVDEICIQKSKSKTRESVVDVRLKLLHRVLLVIESMRRERVYPTIDGLNEYERLSCFRSAILGGDEHQSHKQTEVFGGLYRSPSGPSSTDVENLPFDKEILFFIALNLHGIPCRIYFAIGSTIHVFHEYVMNGKVVEHVSMHSGNCFSIDFNGCIKDQTSVFSKSCTNHRIFQRILEVVKSRIDAINALSDDSCGRSTAPVDAFEDIDRRRISAIPTSISKIKVHPLYITESICTSTQFIYPKRPVLGVIKGQPVYSRKNLQKLKTEKGWYREGRKIMPHISKPYRIVQDKRLFAEFQTKPVELDDITGRLMDAFHPNMTPRNSVHIDYTSEICKELGIKYSDCLVGFRGKEIVIRGFFVNKVHCFLVNYFIREREYYRSVLRDVQKYESVLAEWRKLISKTRKFLRIRKRVGM